MRYITMKWTTRNIDRMIRWFKISWMSWQGFFESKIGPGYKTATDGTKITFVFPDYIKRRKS
jgi:hypothetical protein